MPSRSSFSGASHPLMICQSVAGPDPKVRILMREKVMSRKKAWSLDDSFIYILFSRTTNEPASPRGALPNYWQGINTPISHHPY